MSIIIGSNSPSPKEQPLVAHQLIKEGNIKELKKLLARRGKTTNTKIKSKEKGEQADGLSEIEATDRRGQTVLHVAVECGDLEIVKYLIEMGAADLNAKDKSGWTALHVACSIGQLDVIDFLITRAGADVNALSIDRSTPLHYFVRHGPPEEVDSTATKEPKERVFRKRESELRKSNTIFALKKVRSLDFDPSCMAIAQYANTPEGTFFKLLEMLIARGRGGPGGKGGRDASNINAKNKNGDTPLHIAAIKGHARVVSFLVQRGANVNVTNKWVLPHEKGLIFLECGRN